MAASILGPMLPGKLSFGQQPPRRRDVDHRQRSLGRLAEVPRTRSTPVRTMKVGRQDAASIDAA
jgi:hypothetical protein